MSIHKSPYFRAIAPKFNRHFHQIFGSKCLICDETSGLCALTKKMILARFVLALGSAAAFLLWAIGVKTLQTSWFAGPPGIHVLAVGVLGNLLFIAFPFWRRKDLALLVAISLGVGDIASCAHLWIGFTDMAAVVLTIMPVWVEELRATSRREICRRQASSTELDLSLNFEDDDCILVG
jgi:hypothetical protein